MNQEIKSSIDTAKRACSRCFSHKTFNPKEEDKEIAQKSTKRAYELINQTFDKKRREEETTLEQINILKTAKRVCLDAIDDCKSCDKEQPRIRQKLIDIK